MWKRLHALRNSLSARVAFWVALGTLGPVLLLVGLLANGEIQTRRASAAGELSREIEHLSAQLQSHIELHAAALTVMADVLAHAPAPDTTATLLEVSRRSYPGFITLLFADASGTILHAAPENLLAERRTGGKPLNVADRLYFTEAMRDPGTYISDGFRGRGFGHDAIVAVAQRVDGLSGTPLGVVEGSLDLSRLAPIMGAIGEISGSGVVLIDRENKVLYATDEQRFPILSAASDDPSVADVLVDDAARDEPHLAGDGRWWVRASMPLGWTLVGYRDSMVLREIELRQYALIGLLVATALAMALMIAFLVANVTTGALSRLTRQMETFELDAPPVDLRDAGTTREMQRLFSAVSAMGDRLRRSYRQLNSSLEESRRLQSTLERVLAERERQIEDRTAELRARSFELEQANAVLNRIALEDALTGVANRRAFDDLLDLAWRIGIREQRSVCLLTIDADHFKQYNDTLGHQAGDDCLRRIAKTLRSFARRPLDLCARVGGEEFALLLMDLDADALHALASRVVAAIAGQAMLHPGVERRIVTVSVGAAMARPRNGSRAADLIVAADRSLYQAKNGGRNRAGAVMLLGAQPSPRLPQE